MSIATHPTLRLHEALAQCRNERSIGAFLVCLDLAADYNVGEVELPAVWRELGPALLAQSPAITHVETLGAWLAKCMFLPEDEGRWRFFPSATDDEYERHLCSSRKPIDALESLSDVSEGDQERSRLEMEFSQALKESARLQREIARREHQDLELGRKLGAARAEYIGIIEDPDNMYAAFMPAFECKEFLQEYFSGHLVDDPAVVIGRYLKLFYPNATPAEPAIHWHSYEDLRSFKRSWIQDLLAKVCSSLCNCLRVGAADSLAASDAAAGFEAMAQQLLALATYKPISIRDRDQALKNLLAICRAPQALLSSLCRIQDWNAFRREPAILLQILSNMPLGQHRSAPNFVEEYARNLLGDADGLSCIPWAVVENLEEIDSVRYFLDDEDVVAAVKRLLRTWLTATHRNHNDKSPLTPWGLPLTGLLDSWFVPTRQSAVNAFHSSIWHSGQCKNFGQWTALTHEFDNDLLFLLGVAQKFNYNYLSLSGYSDTSLGFAKQAFFENRPLFYLQIIDSAHAAGYAELANAFLAFGIFSHAIVGGSISGWSKRRLADLIARSEGSPGGRMVSKALTIAASVQSSDDEQVVHRAWLSSYVTKPLAHEIFPRPVGRTRNEIERTLQNNIGEKCWLWMFPDTKSYLIDAEFMYSTCHLVIGTGEIINYGGLAGNYCKALEADLLGRFRDVFYSPEFAMYKAENNLRGPETLGTAVYLIDKFAQLPIPMRSLMQSSRLLAHEDVELVKWLKLFRDKRNRAAHPSKFDDREFMEIRRISMQIYGRLNVKMS